MKSKSSNIDAINIGLMFVALIPAMLLPFELFIFVYAFLGPLHYLTEINWLHKKNYFTTQKYDFVLLVVITVLICTLILVRSEYRHYTPILFFIAAAGAFGMVAYKSYAKKIIFIIVSLIVGSIVFHFFSDGFKIFFTNLLPSIVHVFIFTGAFIILGSLKSKSSIGMWSAVVFIACAAITLFASPRTGLTHVTENIYNYYGSFRSINKPLLDFSALCR